LGNTLSGRELNSLNEEDLIYTTLSLVRASRTTRELNSTYARRRGPTESRRSGRLTAIAGGRRRCAETMEMGATVLASLASPAARIYSKLSTRIISFLLSQWRATFVFVGVHSRVKSARLRARLQDTISIGQLVVYISHVPHGG